MPSSLARSGQYPESSVALSKIKSILTCLGYNESINYSFLDSDFQKMLMGCKKGIILANPLADNLAEMRQSLLPGLLATLMRNLNHQHSRVRLFESGNVFHRRGKSRSETPRIAALATGLHLPRQWGSAEREVDFFDIKGDLEQLLAVVGPRASKEFKFKPATHPILHPGQSAFIYSGRKKIGHVGQLHPAKQGALDIEQPVFMFEIDLEAISRADLPRFVQISRFPPVQRDLAVVVDIEVPAATILDVVKQTAGEQLKKLELFDIYTGERVENNKKSFAFSLTFQSESSSLKAGEIEAIIENIIKALQNATGAQLRT